MFVLTEHDNEAALATYRKAPAGFLGGRCSAPEPAGVMFTWHWTDR